MSFSFPELSRSRFSFQYIVMITQKVEFVNYTDGIILYILIPSCKISSIKFKLSFRSKFTLLRASFFFSHKSIVNHKFLAVLYHNVVSDFFHLLFRIIMLDIRPKSILFLHKKSPTTKFFNSAMRLPLFPSSIPLPAL